MTYRAWVPSSWVDRVRYSKDHLEDTTLPTLSLEWDDVSVVFHPFPTAYKEQRIPPEAQIARWQRQTGEEGFVEPISIGGFYGYRFEAGNEKAVLAFALALRGEHYQALTGSFLPREEHLRSEYTVKAVGSKRALELLKSDIEGFVESIHLINPIPDSYP